MEREDLKANTVYWWHYGKNNEETRAVHIGKVYKDGSDKLGPHIDLKRDGNVFSKHRHDDYSINSGLEFCRLATSLEIIRFNRSIAAGYVVKEVKHSSGDALEIF